MKQQLPMFDLMTSKKLELNKPDSAREENQNLQNLEIKNTITLRQKLTMKDRKFANDTREKNINNYHQSENLHKNIIKEYEPVAVNEEKEKSQTNLYDKKQSVKGKENFSENQLAQMKIEEIKKKNEDLQKKQEILESKITYKLKLQLEKIVDNNYFVVFFMILTIFIMFIGDIQNGWLPASIDDTIDIIQTCCLALFTFEIILTCLSKSNYTNSFFFWLDVVSTLSIIQDIGFIFDPLLNLGSTPPEEDLTLIQLDESQNNSTDVGGNSKGVKNINQALSKITAVSRITRVLRIIRVIRLIRIVKLYKNAMLARENILKKRKEKEKLKNMKKPSIEITQLQDTNPINSERRESKILLELGNNNINTNYIPIINGVINNGENNHLILPNINLNKINNEENKEENKIGIKKNFSIMSPRKTRISRGSTMLNERRLKLLAEERKRLQDKELEKQQLSMNKDKIVIHQKHKKKEISLDNLISESKTSKTVTEAITKKVIILILSILIMLPILDDTFYSNDDILSYNILTKYLANYLTIFSNNSDINNLPQKLNDSLFELILNETDENYPIVNITGYQNFLFINSTFADFDFRKSDLNTAVSSDGGVIVIYTLIYESQLNSLLNIIKTLCLCLLVTVATIYFENDVKRLVLDPLEVMIEIVDKVSKDPIKAKNLDNLETGMKNTLSKLKKDENEKMNNKDKEESEVNIIKSAIMKISALLAIGIGEAGNEIIKENLSNHNDLNPMMQGRKKNAIFGFCDIRGFPSVNEALQEDTMVFLNQIADIVHSSVDLFNGATNKNIGDAFLMVWKLPNDFQNNPNQITKDIATPPANENINVRMTTQADKFNNEKIFLKKMESNTNLKMINIHNPELKITQDINRIADSAVFGFLKIIIKINRDLRILAYRENEEILKIIENFKVNMGFGLHMGWAIEGAIGSNYKIDASYLSPNVNMAARLEAATRQYGVSLLISGPLYDLLSEEVKNLCRLIDIVTVKGSIKPIKFYTIDLNENLKPSKKIKKDFSDKAVRSKQHEKKKEMKKILENVGMFEFIMKKKSFRRLLKNARPKLFNLVFKDAFESYIGGQWNEAEKKFEECIEIFPDDGPTKTILNYIREHDCMAPMNWEGYRALTSK